MIKSIKCPDCDSKKVVKRGKRKQRFEFVQLYQCKDCNRRFTTKSFENKTYPPKIIYNAINHYNLGNTLDETCIFINKRFKIKTSKSTIHLWLKEFNDLYTISKFKNRVSKFDKILFVKRFEHENLEYKFMYHNYKLNDLAKTRFPDLFNYIISFQKGCPDVFFEIGERCSQPKFETKVNSKRKVNLACKMASFAVKAKSDNRERHDLVEKFMIINDKATIACEVPVWYWEKSIDNGITGHIDILQVRNNHVYILDYKPNASKDKKAASQLYHYAIALSFRAKVPFEHIRCAWFDSQSYYEFSPKDAEARLIKKA